MMDQITAVDRNHAPTDGYQIGAVRELVPEDDVTVSPPVTAKLFFSEEFTDEEGEERTYVIELEHPEGVENTVVRMKNVPTTDGHRIFRRFLERTAEERYYDIETVELLDYLESE